MAEVPQKPLEVTQKELEEWYKSAIELKKLKLKEITLRKVIFKKAFPNPKEGTNSFDLADGFVLKGTYSLDRSIDQGALDALKDKLREDKMNPDVLVVQKPSLAKKEYNKLSDEQKKLFDQCLVIKPGSPSMEIIMPAKNRPAEPEA